MSPLARESDEDPEAMAGSPTATTRHASGLVGSRSIGRSVLQHVVTDPDTFTQADRDGVIEGDLDNLLNGLSVEDQHDEIASIAISCD